MSFCKYKSPEFSEDSECQEYFVWVLQIHQCQLSSIEGILAFHVTSANAFQMIWRLKLKISYTSSYLIPSNHNESHSCYMTPQRSSLMPNTKIINYLHSKSVGKRKGTQGAKIQRSVQIFSLSCNRSVYFEFL